jgi:hypothetical protein
MTPGVNLKVRKPPKLVIMLSVLTLLLISKVRGNLHFKLTCEPAAAAGGGGGGYLPCGY